MNAGRIQRGSCDVAASWIHSKAQVPLPSRFDTMATKITYDASLTSTPLPTALSAVRQHIVKPLQAQDQRNTRGAPLRLREWSVLGKENTTAQNETDGN